MLRFHVLREVTPGTSDGVHGCAFVGTAASMYKICIDGEPVLVGGTTLIAAWGHLMPDLVARVLALEPGQRMNVLATPQVWVTNVGTEKSLHRAKLGRQVNSQSH